MLILFPQVIELRLNFILLPHELYDPVLVDDGVPLVGIGLVSGPYELVFEKAHLLHLLPHQGYVSLYVVGLLLEYFLRGPIVAINLQLDFLKNASIVFQDVLLLLLEPVEALFLVETGNLRFNGKFVLEVGVGAQGDVLEF